MKVGFRKPSIKKSIKARTTGKLKRQVKKAVIPGYGKKGMGWVKNPKKAMYNKVYNKTTFGVSDLMPSGKGKRKSTGSGRYDAPPVNGASPLTYRVCGVIMKIVAVLMAILGLLGLIGGMWGLLIFAVILAFGLWKIGSAWSKWGRMPKEDTVDETIETEAPTGSTAQDTQAEPQKTERHKVAGTSFHLKEIQTLGVENSEYKMTKKQLIDEFRIAQRVYKTDYYANNIELIPEPENPHDPRAIRVVADGVHIGYIKSGSCAHIHKLLDEDKIESIKCEIEGGRYKILLEDCDEDGNATYELENDEIPLHADLFIKIK